MVRLNKNHIINLVLIVAAAAGIVLLMYPHVSFWLAKQYQMNVTQEYEEELEELDLEAMLAAAKAYNDMLRGNGLQDPFIEGSGKVLSDEYMNLLNVDGVMGHIKIPKIDVDMPLYHGTSEMTLIRGAGHLEGSALPIGGMKTHAVITGHTGLASAKMFTDLIELETGDEFYLYVLDQVLAYKVDQIQVIDPKELGSLRPIENKDIVSLVTCTPYGINNKRLVVRGVRTSYSPEEMKEKIANTDKALGRETLLFLVSIGVIAILLMIFIVAGRKHWRCEE